MLARHTLALGLGHREGGRLGTIEMGLCLTVRLSSEIRAVFLPVTGDRSSNSLRRHCIADLGVNGS